MQADLNLRWAHIIEGVFSDVAARPTDTVNPLYTDTRYNDKIRYNDNLSVTKPLLKKRRLMRNYAKKIARNFKQHMTWIFFRNASGGQF